MNPHPFVYWAQNRTHLFLRVDLKDAKDPDVKVDEESLKCSAIGTGAMGNRLYEFHLSFDDQIDPLASQYRVTARQIDFSLKKEKTGWWPKPFQGNNKPSWLKIDFDKWKSEDDDEEETLKDYNNYLEDGTASLPPTFNLEKMKKIYLFVYNLWQFFGFLYILGIVSINYWKKGPDFIPHAYQSVHHALKFCQLMQMLEIFHPLFGYTKGSTIEPFIQVGGRCVILFCLIESEERIQEKPVIFYLVMCWSIIEVFRYPYYMTRIYNLDFGLITWLRYTMWIPLYPLGFLCEGVVILRNIPYFEETEKFSIALPNSWNFSFHFPTLMRMYLLFFFLPAMYTMMSHMQRNRALKLGRSKSSS